DRRAESTNAAGTANYRRRARRVGVSHRDPLVTTLTEKPPVARRTNGHRMPPLPPTGGGDGPERDPGPRRPRLDNIRIAMLFLVCGEFIFSGGLFSPFRLLRLSSALGPPPLQPRLPVGVTGVNTLVLLASSIAMLAAARAAKRDDTPRLVGRLLIAAALGSVFLIVQGYGWVRLVGFGLTVSAGGRGRDHA